MTDLSASVVRNWLRAAVHTIASRAHRALLERRRPDRIRKVLVSGYTGLGHLVLRSALVRQIESCYPGCAIAIITGNAYGTEQVFEDRRVWILRQDRGLLAKLVFFLQLRRERFDAVFLTFDAAPKFLIRGCLLAGIPIRVGHIVQGADVPAYYYTHPVEYRRSGPRAEIELNLDLVATVYGRSFHRIDRPRIERPAARGLLEAFGLAPNRYVAVQIGAANGQPTTKRWPEGHFRALIERLLDAYSTLTIVALGDEGDAPIVRRVCLPIHSRRLIDVAGQIGISESKRLIADARFLICHDSGLLHLANALGTPVIALYGPSEPDVYAVRLPSCLVLQEPCSCPPLGLLPGIDSLPEAEAASRCPLPHCMYRLSVDRVFEACAGLLDESTAVESDISSPVMSPGVSA